MCCEGEPDPPLGVAALPNTAACVRRNNVCSPFLTVLIVQRHNFPPGIVRCCAMLFLFGLSQDRCAFSFLCEYVGGIDLISSWEDPGRDYIAD